MELVDIRIEIKFFVCPETRMHGFYEFFSPWIPVWFPGYLLFKYRIRFCTHNRIRIVTQMDGESKKNLHKKFFA
jgi:hypothetical protein